MDTWKILPLIFMCLQLPHSSHAGIPPKGTCWDTALTQLAMNECAGKEYREADAEMTIVYKKLMALPAPAFNKALRNAQRAWLKYRDAQLATYYPDSKEFYGTVRPMCSAQILTELTRQRIQELKKYLAQQEGNVCAPNVDVEPSS